MPVTKEVSPASLGLSMGVLGKADPAVLDLKPSEWRDLALAA